MQTVEKKRVEIDLSQFTGDSREELAKMYDETLRDYSQGAIVTGKVLEVRPSEVLLDIGCKSEGVVPAREFENVAAVKPGDTFSVMIAELEDENGMVILSKEKADLKLRWDRVEASCKEGGVVIGKVRSRVRGGMIVDVEGVDAFLPGSQVDITPPPDPDALVGREFEFKVLKISTERRNIIVSRRELLEETLRSKRRDLLATIEPGQRRTGMVKNITDFGAFVDLDGLDGLLHITDMSWGRIKHPSEMVQVGQQLEVVILDVDREKERVSLGLKQKGTNPWDNIEQKYPVGSRLRGKIVNLVPYGAFVELEPGVEGLVHVSEISWTRRITRASDVLSLGQDVDVVVLNINKDDQKIALGMRQTEDNPWDTVQTRYPVGSRVHGKVRNFTSYGAFVELEDGIDGMIHVSDMSWTRKINHPSELLQKAQDVDAIVLEVDAQQQRISLGLKQATDDPWSTITNRYQVGQVVEGTVTKIAAFGAFMEIEEGVDGLVHISELSGTHVEKVRDVVDVGHKVKARIVRIDKAERRIGLSIKAVDMPDEEFKARHAEPIEGLRPGEHMVDLAGAFEQAMGGAMEEWSPGDRERRKHGKGDRERRKDREDDEA